jgi:hypothetical protein
MCGWTQQISQKYWCYLPQIHEVISHIFILAYLPVQLNLEFFSFSVLQHYTCIG